MQWIEEGRPGEGSLIVYNNGVNRAGTYSSVDVITPVFLDGEYQLDADNRFLPNSTSWSWNQGADMYSGFVSGAERLPNGNTLIAHGTHGTLYEVTLEGEIVWTYINPVSNQGTIAQGDLLPDGNQANSKANPVFRARKARSGPPRLWQGETLDPERPTSRLGLTLCPEARGTSMGSGTATVASTTATRTVCSTRRMTNAPGYDDGVDAEDR